MSRSVTANLIPGIPNLTRFDYIVISSSAGKDSQAMLDYVCWLASLFGVLHRVVVVHAGLGRVEWKGTAELAEEQAARYGVRFIKVRRGQGDLLTQIEQRGKFPGPATRYCTAHHKQNQVAKVFTSLTDEAREDDLLSHIEAHGKWPDPARRYCTSDHKRNPIRTLYTALADEDRKTSGKQKPRRVRILSCMGMRADESPKRAKLLPLSLNRGKINPETGKRRKGVSSRRRFVWDWLPLHSWSEADVWQRIKEGKTADLIHRCYSLGMPRCSCVFCIFAPKEALILAGHHNPELLAEYVRVEQKIKHRFKANLSMLEVAEAVARGEGKTAKVTSWTM